MSLNAMKIFTLIILQFIIFQPISSTFVTDNGRDDLRRICGRTGQRNAKIVGGEEAVYREFPWFVHIKMKGEPHCGGALISNNFILTAAHCLASRPSDIFTVKLGSLHLNSNAEIGVIEMPILKYQIHKFFNRPRSFSNDIALIKINPINFTDQILPICLPSSTVSNYEHLTGKVAGFGWLQYPIGKLPNSLQKVDLPIISNKDCEAWFRENHHHLKISDSQFCAGYAEGQRDACKGDSGSPFMIRINNHTEVIGVVSAGIRCADPKTPGVYTKTSFYLDWIQHEMARL